MLLCSRLTLCKPKGQVDSWVVRWWTFHTVTCTRHPDPLFGKNLNHFWVCVLFFVYKFDYIEEKSTFPTLAHWSPVNSTLAWRCCLDARQRPPWQCSRRWIAWLETGSPTPGYSGSVAQNARSHPGRGGLPSMAGRTPVSSPRRGWSPEPGSHLGSYSLWKVLALDFLRAFVWGLSGPHSLSTFVQIWIAC